MKIIRKVNHIYNGYIDYKCKYGIIKRVFNNGQIRYFKHKYQLHRVDGAAIENCNYYNGYALYNKYKRVFCLYNLQYSVTLFAEKTNHKICLICNDFCKQECFIE